ncbi:MAG: tyrosine-type recombinase/integrase [Lachnospira sp.]|nr:tyrosine-type recombinase/integrase [Lachnospira sp.]
MKLPNGYGSIYRMSGKRRKPWRVVLTAGWDLKDGRAVRDRQTLGFYRTRAEAVEALAKYHAAPFDVSSVPTFAEVYKLWTDEHFPNISASRKKNINAVYKRFSKLYDMPFRDIRTRDFEAVCRDLMDAGRPATYIHEVVSIFHQMSGYAMRKDMIQRDTSAAIHLDMTAEKSRIHHALSPEEIGILWDHADDPTVQIILIGIATGVRPDELLQLKSVDFHDFYVIGGSKTEAGRNRIIPLHPDIRPFLHPETEYLIGEVVKYDTYRYRSKVICGKIGIKGFLPHDTRHTFATLWASQKLDPIIGRRIMGHAVNGVTEQVYVHRSAADLYRELCKLDLHPKTAEVKKFKKDCIQ